MSDLISRNALFKEMDEKYAELENESKNTPDIAEAFCIIDALVKETPTVDAVPVVRGEWLIAVEGIERNLNTWEHIVKRKYFCNRCDYSTGNQGKHFNFCPNCGADMRKKVEE